MGTGSLIPIMIIDDHSRYSTHENNKKDQMAAVDEMGGCLKNAMTDCYLNNTVTKEAYISNIQSYFSQAAHKLTFEPDMEVTLVDQYGRPWNAQSSVPFTSEPAVPQTATAEPKTISEPAVFMTTTELKTTSVDRIAAPVGFVADIIDSGQGKAVSIAFQEVVGAIGYKLYVDGTYMRDIPTAVNIPTAEFVPGNHTFAVTAFDAASESNKTPAVTLKIEGKPSGFTDLRKWFDEKLKYCKETYENASGILDWNSDTETAYVFLTANGISEYAEFKSGVDNTYIDYKTNKIFVNEMLLWQTFGRVIDPPIEYHPVRDSLIAGAIATIAVKGPKLVGSLIKRFSTKIVEVVEVADEIDRVIEGASGAKLNQAQIADYVDIATNNPTSDTFVLGSTGQYDIIAQSNGYTYFKMADEIWDGLETITNKNYDEIWKVNKSFIDTQISSGKSILLTNDPKLKYIFDDGTLRFYQRELNYLGELGYSFEKIGDGLWKAIK